MATMPNFDAYGGATITRVVDGAQAEWIGMCGKMDGRFGFYVWRNSVNIPLTPFCTGRGSIEENGHWIAWDGSVYHTGALPGFVPLPKGAPVAIPAGGALDALYAGSAREATDEEVRNARRNRPTEANGPFRETPRDRR